MNLLNKFTWLDPEEFVPHSDDLDVLIFSGARYFIGRIAVCSDGSYEVVDADGNLEDCECWTVIVTAGIKTSVNVMQFALDIDTARELADRRQELLDMELEDENDLSED